MVNRCNFKSNPEALDYKITSIIGTKWGREVVYLSLQKFLKFWTVAFICFISKPFTFYSVWVYQPPLSFQVSACPGTVGRRCNVHTCATGIIDLWQYIGKAQSPYPPYENSREKLTLGRSRRVTELCSLIAPSTSSFTMSARETFVIHRLKGGQSAFATGRIAAVNSPKGEVMPRERNRKHLSLIIPILCIIKSLPLVYCKKPENLNKKGKIFFSYLMKGQHYS